MKQIDSEKKLDRLKLYKLLKTIYSNNTTEEINFISNQLLQILDDFSEKSSYEEIGNKEKWNQSHSVLITYADSIYKTGEPTLITLRDLLSKHFGSLSRVVHILPFLKSTSDGGFAVSSYDALEEKFGDWDDLKSISKNHVLMADLVLNHVSSSHPWVQQFIKSQEPGISNVFSPEQNLDWSNVVRPRSSSLFSQINTEDGPRQVWTTFGPDQIDLNWHNPKMTLEFLNLIITYLSNGIKWFRLDAVGFIWKESGTTCLHLPKAHSIVKILRLLLNYLIYKGVLITETNVPQKENLSYLIPEDEAHMAYNFPLPPLLLEAIITSRADILNSWIFDWPKLPDNTTLFNFTASHDGIGLRALEGLMNEERITDLLISCEKRGGLVSHRRLSNGDDKPYELNISWWSAMEDSSRDSNRFQFERFILTQLLVMALKGIPAFYLPALLASKNDIKSFSMTGQRRDLNREKFKSDTLLSVLNNPESNANKNLKFLHNAMDVRSELKQFHPCSDMDCLSRGRSDIVVIKRGKGSDPIFAIHNITENKINYQLNDIDLPKLIVNDFNMQDFLTSTKYNCKNISLDPFQVVWLGSI
ncbi:MULTISPECIES: sugar phosphorylase [Prochlorococcus]|uniref:Putative sucrose phosphorylase n=1 Tax=Prochlorococcus marinus str. MIT 9116 TaxID=167544 RepID=A0A0A1ZQ07_PROMR|nr:sugar phosphorylase [Prochlorococcus marinus]KGF89651.1 putative sucrose phosphorylase [Prochlorococcus marinus str. MIT 9107]KGF90339.1 putative sucrose phosphorylase [Prochlorococcus marinus str. MIT 9116]KGF92819.1 putative sucrose phosphorylase [Prochlorococcus marinus str. MIT 9123]